MAVHTHVHITTYTYVIHMQPVRGNVCTVRTDISLCHLGISNASKCLSHTPQDTARHCHSQHGHAYLKNRASCERIPYFAMQAERWRMGKGFWQTAHSLTGSQAKSTVPTATGSGGTGSREKAAR